MEQSAAIRTRGRISFRGFVGSNPHQLFSLYHGLFSTHLYLRVLRILGMLVFYPVNNCGLYLTYKVLFLALFNKVCILCTCTFYHIVHLYILITKKYSCTRHVCTNAHLQYISKYSTYNKYSIISILPITRLFQISQRVLFIVFLVTVSKITEIFKRP